MQIYLDAVMALNFIVDFFLLLGTNRLTGYPPGLKRTSAAALLGSIYGAVCLLPEFRFLGSTLWRFVFLGLMSMIAFGINSSALSRGAIFILLSMALGGISTGFGVVDFWAVCICAGLIWLLCRIGFRDPIGNQRYIPVELNWQGRTVKLMALQDTGNTLRDPLTGEQILVCGADVGEELLNIPRTCFSDPVETISSGTLPGLRLVPYHAVGQSNGMMLALRLKHVKIDGRASDPLVAFAPQEIGKGETYRMLTGGKL